MWLQKQVSLYSTYADNTGRPATFQDILFADCIKDIHTIVALRKLDRSAADFKNRKLQLKGSLQCFTPAALLETKKKGMVKEITRPGMMQLDFDHQDISEFDVEELKQCVFSLPFIGFCGLSCSGEGFYALALIAEPEKLSDYAEHCFDVLLKYGIKADTSKGKKPENLRYVSYDANMLIRDNPEPLYIKHFKPKPSPKPQVVNTQYINESTVNNAVVNKQLKLLNEVMIGSRWSTVQKVSYTLGGLEDSSLMDAIKQCIRNNSAFSGEEDKYIKCAGICFKDGMMRPFLLK